MADGIEPPAPFSVLSEHLQDMKGAPSLDSVLANVTKQTGLQLDQLDDVLPLSPEAKWFQSATLTTEYNLKDTAASFVRMGAPIQDSVDVENLKWALAEAAKAEPVRCKTVNSKEFCIIKIR